MKASDVIDGRYRLERVLGTGGMSEVWLAEDQRLGRPVAVKLLQRHDDEFAVDLEREARLVARLQHPNIAAVYDAGRHDGVPYLVAEYIEGMSVRQMIEERGRLAEADAVRYGVQIANALQYAHGQGVVHCDIKPENILVAGNGVAKAVDFGVAETVTRTLTVDQARDILGTVGYLAPEVMQGKAAGPPADIYSLALTVFEMVAGRLPFAGGSPAALASQRLASPAPGLRTFAIDASPALERVLARALALSPEDRYRDAGEFAAALSQVVRPTPAPGVGAPAIVTRRAPRAAAPGPIPAQAPRRPRHTARIRRGRAPRRNNSAAALVAVGAVFIAAAIVAAAAIVFLDDDNSGGALQTPTATATEPPASTPIPEPTLQPTETPTATETPAPTETPTSTPTEVAPTATEEPPTSTPEPDPTETPTQPDAEASSTDS